MGGVESNDSGDACFDDTSLVEVAMLVGVADELDIDGEEAESSPC